MPRQAHGRPLTSSGPSTARKRKSTKSRGLNALETAEKQFPDEIKIRQHRLGEAEDDEDLPRDRAGIDGRSSKRRKIDRHNSHDEDASSAEEGSDLDGERWHVGVDGDDEDSDIDSDEAFGESDEERFAGFTFRGSSKNAQRGGVRQRRSNSRIANGGSEGGTESADSQGTEDGSEDLGEDAIDLATALDMNEKEEQKLQEKSSKRTGRPKKPVSVSSAGDDQGSDASGSESRHLDDSDVYSVMSASGDEDDADTTKRLRTFIDGLTSAQEVDSKVWAETYSKPLPAKPSRYGLPSTSLSAADLMQYVKDPAQRQSLKILRAAEEESPVPYKGGVPGKLAAPLAKRQQDRLDRVAAYDQGKQTMERWVETVKKNRRADHVSYATVDAAKASASNVKSFQPIFKSQPHSDLELKIQEIMQESGLGTVAGKTEEEEEQHYEELQEKKIPLDEVQARRRELRLQRELMFREEIRAKRIKKIKSKAFRRVHRKEKDKFAVQERERLAAAGMLDSDEEREQSHRRRAEERMGARHREGRWAKAAKASGQTIWNEDAKTGVSDMARRDEELRRRIEGKNIRGSGESESEFDPESDQDSLASDGDEQLNRKLDSLKTAALPSGKSKLSDMAFMRKAEGTRQAQNDEELRLLRRALTGQESDDSEGASDSDTQPARQKYGNSKSKGATSNVKPPERNEFEAHLSEDEKEAEEENETGDGRPANSKSSMVPKPRPQTLPSSQIQHSNKTTKARSGTTVSTASHKPNVQNKGSKSRESALDDYTSPSESEDEAEEREMDDKTKLALEVFAGEDEGELQKQFEKEKKATVEEEGDQVVDNTLPGWGSWTGAGISKREQRKGKGRVFSLVKGVAPEARKDAKLERVIVNEKRVKKNSKYLAAELPHQFESRQQYERALRLPMGPEWSTRNHFQDAIKPRVLLKQGQVIRPLAKPNA